MSVTLDIARKEVAQVLKNNKIVQLNATWCPDCVYTQSVFRKYDIIDNVKIFEIGHYGRETPEFQNYYLAFQEAANKKNLPLIFVDGKFIGTEHTFHQWESSKTLEKEFKNLGIL